MQILDGVIKELVSTAFKKSIENKDIEKNYTKSSYFVSNLADVFLEKHPDKEAFVQHTDEEGKKMPGEWMLDIAIVSMDERTTSHNNKLEPYIIKKIHWAIESEFSTSFYEFGRDFSKLLHIRSEAYLYINGLNQTTDGGRNNYINNRTELAKELITEQGIDKPFYLAFVPTPGKTTKHTSFWEEDPDKLISYIEVKNLQERQEK